MLQDQNWKCSVCLLPIADRKSVIDHEHVKGWKKMKPQERKRYVRGILHRFCNSHCVGRFMNLDKARNIVKYLQAYEGRKKCSNGCTSRTSKSTKISP